MKLEAGKHYKTRDRRKALVMCVSPNQFVGPWNGKSFVGVVQGCGCFVYWNEDGSRYEAGKSDLDLVGEWREPRTWEVEVVKLEHCDGEIRTYFADTPSLPWNVKVIARKIVTLTEGEV